MVHLRNLTSQEDQFIRIARNYVLHILHPRLPLQFGARAPLKFDEGHVHQFVQHVLEYV